jgi:hypothetical protein
MQQKYTKPVKVCYRPMMIHRNQYCNYRQGCIMVENAVTNNR